MGLWLRTVLDADHAPLTSFNPPVDHIPDLWIVPLIVVLDTRIPPDAMAVFESFPGEHQVRRSIADQRIATAWIGKTVIYGGEITGHTRDVDAQSQFHAVTVQWQAPEGKIGWIQLTRSPAIDAVADQSGIAISAAGDVSFRISAPAIAASDATQLQWNLSGLTVCVKADAKSFSATKHGPFVAKIAVCCSIRLIRTFSKTCPARTGHLSPVALGRGLPARLVALNTVRPYSFDRL
jgi:hypothetical protein